MASVDRLAQLHGNSHGHSVPLQPMGNSANSYQNFLDEATNLQQSIRDLNDSTERIRATQSRLLDSTDETEQGRLRRELEKQTNRQQEDVNAVKARVKAFEPIRGSPDFAIHQNQFRGVTKSFMDAIQRYRTVESDFQRAESRLLERQIRIVNPNATQQDIDEALDNARQGGRPVFIQSLVGGRRDQAAGTLQAVQERHNDIQRLAQTIGELSALFEDMRVLVDSQGKVIDNIEVSTQEVNDQLRAANSELVVATEKAWATRNKKWICFWILVIIIIVIVIVVLWYLGVIPHSPAK
ncbi:t-SNARE [Jimgerdemannia flammicorona]|uniref:t-SNARE n=2 Tax=Jimgerdemannia flammicorona TaxID=994334 RepID=A0A433Q9S4_9FUNG|nr:t-SNARE [Jimgerdemannia flammicorona]RUS26537.1 t-SNARE [Jimgerdemannia flammicorona]